MYLHVLGDTMCAGELCTTAWGGSYTLLKAAPWDRQVNSVLTNTVLCRKFCIMKGYIFFFSLPLFFSFFQIVSLGAGFDSLFFRLHADEALDRAVVFEVDFPDVTRRKAALINSNITLKGMLDSHLPSLTGLSFPSHTTHSLHSQRCSILFRSLEKNILDFISMCVPLCFQALYMCLLVSTIC